MKPLLDQLRTHYGLCDKGHCRDGKDKALILKLIEIIEEQSEALDFYATRTAIFDDDDHNNDKTGQALIDAKIAIRNVDNGRESRAVLTSTEEKLRALVEGK